MGIVVAIYDRGGTWLRKFGSTGNDATAITIAGMVTMVLHEVRWSLASTCKLQSTAAAV